MLGEVEGEAWSADQDPPPPLPPLEEKTGSLGVRSHMLFNLGVNPVAAVPPAARVPIGAAGALYKLGSERWEGRRMKSVRAWRGS